VKRGGLRESSRPTLCIAADGTWFHCSSPIEAACASPLLQMFLFCSNPAEMPRDGARTLSDIREPTLTVVCAPCGRRGRYDVARLLAQHGDAKFPDLLVTLANCPKARSASIHERCKAVYERPQHIRRAF
jgi:hypothetical protein